MSPKTTLVTKNPRGSDQLVNRNRTKLASIRFFQRLTRSEAASGDFDLLDWDLISSLNKSTLSACTCPSNQPYHKSKLQFAATFRLGLTCWSSCHKETTSLGKWMMSAMCWMLLKWRMRLFSSASRSALGHSGFCASAGQFDTIWPVDLGIVHHLKN